MSIGIGVPNGVVNLYTVHMVQTFKGNYTTTRDSFPAATLTNDKYFGTFFFAKNDAVAGPNVGQIVANLNYNATTYDGSKGAYDRGVGDTGSNETASHPLFPFDFDGVQGAIKAKGDERWLTFKGMYNATLTLTSTAGDGSGSYNSAYRNARGTWRYAMNKEAGMANSIKESVTSGAGYDKSTITKTFGGNQVDHKAGKFNIGGATKLI